MQDDTFNFVNYFKNFINSSATTKEEMINKYIKGQITKQELDEFMKGCNKND